MPKRVPMADEEAIKIVEAIARDETAKATVRLNATKQLLAWRQMRAGGGSGKAADDDSAPDPFADLDELETRRQRRQRR